MSRYVVVAPLTPMAVGDLFTTREWPLHVTLVQVFATEATLDEIARRLATVAAGSPAITVVAGDETNFGRSHTIPVTLVDSSVALDALHAACVAAIEELAPRYESPEFMGAGYRPHVTIKRQGRVLAGDVLELRQLAVVDMEPGQRDGGREVLTVCALGR